MATRRRISYFLEFVFHKIKGLEMWGQTMIPANLQSTANQLCLLLGKEKYAHAKQILISADGGRSKY